MTKCLNSEPRDCGKHGLTNSGESQLVTHETGEYCDVESK